MELNNIFKLVLLVTVLSSCTKTPVEEPSQSALPAATIDGIWSTACIEDGESSYINSIQVADGVMTIAKLKYFESRYCEQNKLDVTLLQSGPISLMGANGTIANGENYEWAFNFIAAVPSSDGIVTMMNAESFCGVNTWAKDQAGILFGCLAPNAFDYSQVLPSTKHYGAFVIQSNVTPQYLQFEVACNLAGYEDICPTANDRPATVGGDVYYRQQ